VLTAALAIASAAETLAQGTAEPLFRARAFELDLGASWLGGIDFGARRAEFVRNQSNGTPFPLFEVDSGIAPAPAFEGRLGFHLTRALALEGAFLYARPRLESRITGDAEDAPSLTASEDVSRYIVDVSAVVHLTGLRMGGSAVPFVLAGAGYLRELHEGRTLVETGQLYHAGGGVKYLFSRRRRGLIRGLGLRLDARIYVRRGGLELDEDEPSRTFAAGGGSLVVLF
jgi:hypothetical protein